MRQKLRGAAAAESPPADQDINEETCGASSEDEMHGHMYSSSRQAGGSGDGSSSDDNSPVDTEAPDVRTGTASPTRSANDTVLVPLPIDLAASMC